MAFKTDRWTLANILPVAFVIWVIVTIWVLYGWLHLLDLLQIGVLDANLDSKAQFRGQVETGISQTLTLLLLICFVRAVFTDPGSVPQTPEWLPEPKAARSHGDETEVLLPEGLCLEVKQSGERRFCKWCDNFKPDRCHHCRICKSCILRMDHHCPWIANCVGFRNHKYFFLLVFYALLNLAFIITTMSETMSRAIEEETTPTRRFLLVFCMTLACLMGGLLAAFFAMHIWLMMNATTTIEFCEKRSRRANVATGCEGPLSPIYDLDFYSNICAVLGPFPPLWLLPIMPPAGDGLSFQAKQEFIKDPDLDESGEYQPEKHTEAHKKKEALPPEVTGARAAVA